MKEPKDYLVAENEGREYSIKKTNGDNVWAYITRDLPDEPLEFFTGKRWNAEVLSISEIDHIIQELPDMYSDDCSTCWDGKIEPEKALLGETICFDCKEKEIRLEPFKTGQVSVYKYDNLDQLQKLYNTLGNPVPDNFYINHKTENIEVKGLKDFGLLYLWSNMGDFDEYPSEYCAIIQGVKA